MLPRVVSFDPAFGSRNNPLLRCCALLKVDTFVHFVAGCAFFLVWAVGFPERPAARSPRTDAANRNTWTSHAYKTG